VLFKDAVICRGYRTSDHFSDVLDKNLLVTITYFVHNRKFCRDINVESRDVNVAIGNKRTGCLILCGFNGLEVACWPLVPKIAGSNPAEAVGFFGR
jgi:hypothetical protein